MVVSAAEEPEVLALAGPEGDGCEGILGRGRHGASCVDGVHVCSVIAAPARGPSPAHGDLSCTLVRTLARMAWTVERLIAEIDLLGSRGLPRR